MPETPVNEYDFAQSREDNVRGPREVACMKPVSKPHAVHEPADDHLWLGVRAFDAGHPLTSFLPGQIIHGDRTILIQILPLPFWEFCGYMRSFKLPLPRRQIGPAKRPSVREPSPINPLPTPSPKPRPSSRPHDRDPLRKFHEEPARRPGCGAKSPPEQRNHVQTFLISLNSSAYISTFREKRRHISRHFSDKTRERMKLRKQPERIGALCSA